MTTGYTLEIEVAGHTELSRFLAGFGRRCENLAPLFQELVADFYRYEAQAFDAEGAIEGLPAWEALSQKYERWKSRHRGGSILVQSGALRDSLTRADAPGAFQSISADEMRLGSTRETPGGRWNLGMLHQQGTDNMPARPPLRLSETRRTAWMKLLREFIMGEG